MKTFELHRDEDETGISGTGVVAQGVVFDDGPVALRWVVGEHRSTVVWRSIEAVEAIHGHGGRTRIVWTGFDDKAIGEPYLFRILRERVGDETIRVLLEPYTDVAHVQLNDGDEFVTGTLRTSPWPSHGEGDGS